MRLARLDLLAFGRFTGASIEFPQTDRDIHIVYGPNEAGKTTSLVAIENLLFGIPTTSSYNFLHSYDTMRIGAVLEKNNDRLEFQRRKGRKDTILGPSGNPLTGGEKLLVAFLGGTNSSFFNRMFSLSHVGLVEGGKALIEANDDVGQMLFAAGTGLADLRSRLKQFEEEADQLWAPRKSSKRRYYQAQDRLEKARSQQREHTLDVRTWKVARKTWQDAEASLRACKQAYERTSTTLKKIARIRSVYSAIRQRQELTQKIKEMGNVILLPEDAGEQLESAEQRDARVGGEIDALTSQLEEDQTALKAIKFDKAYVQRAEEISKLNEQRITVRNEREDLPKRRRELKLEVESLARLAREIGWNFEEPLELIEQIPTRSDVEVVRSLLSRHGEITVELRNVRKTLKESEASLQDKKVRLHEIGDATDVSDLASVLKAVREIGDVSGRMRSAQLQIANISDEVDRKIQSLSPALPKDTNIESLAVPNRDSVITHRDKMKSWSKRLDETKQRLTEARNKLDLDQKELDHRVQKEGVDKPEAVQIARDYRDSLWKLVKASYIEQSEISAEERKTYAESLENLPTSFEEAVEDADGTADRRLDKAQEVGELAVLARNIVRHKTEIRHLEEEKAQLQEQSEELNKKWEQEWTDVPVNVLTPDEMLAWLEIRDTIINLFERERETQRQLESCKQEEQDGIELVHAALTKLGRVVDKNETIELRVIIERADEHRLAEERKAEKIIEMREEVRSAKSEVFKRKDDLESIDAEWLIWQKEWEEAVTALSLASDEKPHIVSAKIKIIDEMRDHDTKARDLRDARIATIERDIEDYEKNVAAITAELAPDLKNGEVDPAVISLDSRRDEALKLSETARDLQKKIGEVTNKISSLNQDRTIDWAEVLPLFEAIGTKNVEELRSAIKKSEKKRVVQDQLNTVMTTLDEQGGGLAIEVLEKECQDVDIDEVKTKEELTEAELGECNKHVEKAIVVETEARTEFEAIGGDDTAARAAADYEEALASMQLAAERYVRVRTSASLLHWVIDRYRKEKQAPLLKRAGELFQILTLNSFEKLEVQFDVHDSMHLVGVRPKGEIVPVLGLSSGVEDQLFLALRIAAVEDYLQRAESLPFVADDLFINFDPDRSAAGFEVLGQLAEQTQVLFYTHHQHLVDIAKDTLGPEVHVETLEYAI